MMATEGLIFNPRPLRRAFLTSGHTLGSLALLIGCSDQTIHNILSGKNPTSKMLPKMAQALGVDVQSCWQEAGGTPAVPRRRHP
jgi:lambda repressor-like predicted transcriptional regulator